MDHQDSNASSPFLRVSKVSIALTNAKIVASRTMAKRKISHGHAVHGKPKPRKNHCFGCGHDNPQGMRLKFSLDEDSRQAICHFKLSRKYTGPPGYAHGGIIATISWTKPWVR